MTNMIRIENESRRRFLRGTAGLTLAVYLPAALGASTAAPGAGEQGSALPPSEPNSFLPICADNTVTVISTNIEMGQGT